MVSKGSIVALVFGALVPRLSDQLKAKDTSEVLFLEPFQHDADCITRLSVRGLLTEKETDRARRRLIQNIREAVSKI